MGRSYTYINLDTREQGIRYYSKLGEELIDPNGRFLRRLFHPETIIKLPVSTNLVLHSSAEQRPHLGYLNLPPEIWTTILARLTDMTSVACFGAAHPLLSQYALERIRDIMMSLQGIGAWAGHRIAFVNEDYRQPLPKEVYTASELDEYDVENEGLEHSKAFIDVGGNPDADHRDEWLACGGEDYHPSSIDRVQLKASNRWAYENIGLRHSRPYNTAYEIDHQRVQVFLNLSKLCRLRAGDYALCNQSKREYVLAQSVAKFNDSCQYSGPYVEANWKLGDTAGFLVTCDVELLGGNGQGQWAGDRICVTTVDLMRDMDGSGKWKNIGLFADEDGFEGDELWGQINENIGRLFSYYGYEYWKDNYRPT